MPRIDQSKSGTSVEIPGSTDSESTLEVRRFPAYTIGQLNTTVKPFDHLPGDDDVLPARNPRAKVEKGG